MKTYREYMSECRENLDWCVPYSFLDGKVVVVRHEGNIEAISVDGKEKEVTPETIREIAKMVNPKYDDCDRYAKAYWTDEEIIFDAHFRDLPCCECPWFNICDAMDVDAPNDGVADD